MSNEHDDVWDLPEDVDASTGGSKATSLTAQSITAALLSAEPDVDLPGNGRPGSAISNLLSLKPGGNYTRSLKMPDDMTLAEVRQNINEWKRQLRQSINQSIRHAKSVDDRNFTMETNATVTPGGAVYVQVIVTRTA